ncbi:MAG: flagellar assembly protein FliW [Nitrospirae bacterium]|nr:flagellar assembly protein FliW [Candidatus Manganitrophaceae bacterium]
MNTVIQSAKLGPVAIDTERLITFPEGIPGFPMAKQYALIENDQGHPFFWLQAVEDLELAFVVVDPLIFLPEYRPLFSPEEMKALEIEKLDTAAVLAILTIPQDDPLKLTANLRAPLVINHKTRRGKQVVLSDSTYSYREPLLTLSALSTTQPDIAALKSS